jgi:hypothetical protein
MANLFNTPNYLFTWKDVKTFLVRSQYNELLNFVTQEFFKNQYKTTALPPFLDPTFTLSLTNFDELCKCGEVVQKKTDEGSSDKERIVEQEAIVKNLEAGVSANLTALTKAWNVFDFARTNDKSIGEPTEVLKTSLGSLKVAIGGSELGLESKLTDVKSKLGAAASTALSIPLSELSRKATEFNRSQVTLENAKGNLVATKNRYSKNVIEAEFAYEEALNVSNKAAILYKEKADITTLQAKENADREVVSRRQSLLFIQGKLPSGDVCRDTEDTNYCTPKFKYIRKQSISNERLIGKNFQLDFTTTGLTVGSVLWLYYYERMGIFKILGVLMDDYNYKGKYTISGSRKNENGSPVNYSALMDMICTLHRLGMSSNLRDRICTYQRTLGVSIPNNLGIESERNQGFMQNFNRLIENMLEYYKSKQLAVAINTGNQPRSAVSTQTSILDTVQLLKQQFEPFQYGRNAINTFLGIATVQATICLVNMLRTEIGIPAQYEKPEEFIPAAYRILVEKRGITSPNESNRFILYDNCASYGLRLLTDIETADINQLTTIGIGATLDLWLDDVEGWVEGYRNAYAALPEGAEAIV